MNSACLQPGQSQSDREVCLRAKEDNGAGELERPIEPSLPARDFNLEAYAAIT